MAYLETRLWDPSDRRRNGDYRPYNDNHHHYRDSHSHRYPRDRDRDHNIDQIGDYVARRIVPELQRGSEHPVQLVMNFGTLYVQDDFQRNKYSNAVVYNAPGCTMVLGSGTRSSAPHTYQTVDYVSSPNAQYHTSSSSRTCLRCGFRRVGAVGAFCRECDFEVVVRAEKSLGRREETDYVRYPERRSISYVSPRW